MQRCLAVIGNLHRLGVNNAVVSNLDGREFAKIMPQGLLEHVDVSSVLNENSRNVRITLFGAN